MATTALQRAGRSDARRNRARVLDAAAEVFARAGVDASVPDIAATAEVGVATVYRHFSTKEELLELVLQARLEQVRSAVAAAGVPLPLEALLLALVEAQIGDRSLAQLIGADLRTMPRAERGRDALFGELVAALDAAKASGQADADLTPEDLTVLLCGVGHAARTAIERGAPWRRLAILMLAGLRRDSA